MSRAPRVTGAAGAATCLGCLVVAAAGARADPSEWPSTGPLARAGTAVGFGEIGDEKVTIVGGELAIGYRLGPFSIEAQVDRLAMLQYVEDEGANSSRGVLSRLGVTGRLFVTELGAARQDPDSILRLYIDGGLGRQSARWSNGDEFERNDVSAGAGWVLDHRWRPRPAGLPFRSFGWQFGWRMTAARADGDDVVLRSTCKKCRPPTPGPEIDYALVVASSFIVSW